MKITALIENETTCERKSKNGLSLYCIETQNHKILLDLGPKNIIFQNAKTRNIGLSISDIAIISHGYMDHGGALKQILEINLNDKIYIQRKAFEAHYSKFLFLKVRVGLNKELKNHPQVMLIDGDCWMDDELSPFTAENASKCYSNANDALFRKKPIK